MKLSVAVAIVAFVFLPVRLRAADLVLLDGRIATVDSEFRVVEALAIQDGRVIAVGSNEEVQSGIGDQTEVVRLGGAFVLPGLIDSHTHPTGASRFEADHEIPPMNSIDDVLAYVSGRAEVVPKGEWITVSQVFITRLKERRYPTRDELDRAAPHHPVLFRTGPDASVNTLALAEHGIDKAFAAQHPSNVLVDAESGEPNGLIRQAEAVLEVGKLLKGKPLSESERDDRLVMLLDDYVRSGITGIIDRNCNDSARSQYGRLLQDNRLPLRVHLSRSLDPKIELPEIEERLDSIVNDPYFKEPDPRLRVIGVKVFEDGGMLTGSAFFNRPWGISQIYGIDDPAYRGMQYIDTERLKVLITACVTRDLAFTAHCQGDAAVESLVEAYGDVNRDFPVKPTHSSITHSSFMTPKAIEGAARIGVAIDLQPAWLYLDANTLMEHFGERRLQYFIPLRSLFDAGVVAGGGSDHMQKIGSLRSVNPYNPFLGMWVAVTRRARWYDDPVIPDQGLSREQMIRFYTVNNAWLMRDEEQLGSLEVGKRADFIIVDLDLMTCPADEIRETQVLSTWIDGKKVFDSQGARPASVE